VQNGAKSPFKLWHTCKDPPAVGAAAGPSVVVADEPPGAVDVAVAAAGAAFNVVAAPLIVVRTGVMVEPFPLASTVTQGFRADSVMARGYERTRRHTRGKQERTSSTDSRTRRNTLNPK
jgi:hypothetical protein